MKKLELCGATIIGETKCPLPVGHAGGFCEKKRPELCYRVVDGGGRCRRDAGHKGDCKDDSPLGRFLSSLPNKTVERKGADGELTYADEEQRTAGESSITVTLGALQFDVTIPKGVTRTEAQGIVREAARVAFAAERKR